MLHEAPGGLQSFVAADSSGDGGTWLETGADPVNPAGVIAVGTTAKAETEVI